MPRTKSAYSRHRIIDRALNDTRHRYPTLEYLARRCSGLLDTDVSASTIEKDLAVMKRPSPVGYDAPIVYSRQHRGYAYSEMGFSISELNLQDGEWTGLKFAAELLHEYRDVPVFADFRNAIERINTCFSLGLGPDDPVISRQVQFERPVAVNGMEWLHLVYEAIRNSRDLRFTYANIYKKRSSGYVISPVLLKEHRNRWYVIGWEAERADHLTFALDRISDAEVLESKGRRRADFDPDGFFHHSVGIMEASAQKAVTVELSIREPISKLVLLEPIHPSQTVVRAGEDRVVVRLLVQLNDELHARILGLGPWCTVTRPLSLRKKIVGMIGEMQSNYGADSPSAEGG